MAKKTSPTTQKNNHIILDSKDYTLGRLATRVAVLLMGKDSPSFRPNIEGSTIVTIKNIQRVKFTGKKMSSKIYYHHSGHPGGLKKMPLEKLFKKNPEEVLRRAVYGMLPKNKLRDKRIKRLVFTTDN